MSEQERIELILKLESRIRDLELENEELQISEGLFRLFAENTPDMVYSFDPITYRFFYISPSFQAKTGYDIREVLADPLTFIPKILYPEDVGRMFNEYRACMQSPPEKAQEPFEYRLKCRDDNVIWINELRFLQYTPEGRVVRMNGIARDITERKRADREREKLVNELQEALSKVKTLSGFLPICSNCKKIRDDSGYWQQVESYIRDHSEAEFSHGICPECARKLYPGIFDDE